MLRIVVAALAFACASNVLAQQVKLTMWSHWAAEKIKRDFVEDAIKRFEAANPNVKIEATWYEKTALYAALKTALLKIADASGSNRKIRSEDIVA